MNSDTALLILAWYIKLSEPNSRRAYYECPVCNATWNKDGLFRYEKHNLDCWIPMLQGEVKPEYHRTSRCHTCNGLGYIIYDGDKRAKCIDCNGAGVYLK